tara:strand:- start:691 stop:1107 length:417 start_codon:yes stop_codon:yes gene_type:complete
MNKAELKAVLKPLIKECIKEVMFEDGVLSGIISEVAQGLTTGVPLTETVSTPKPPPRNKVSKRSPAAAQARQELIESINKDAYGGVNIFEGTEPMHAAGKPSSEPQPGNPLGDVAPNDPGVNIDGILNIAGDAWGKFI